MTVHSCPRCGYNTTNATNFKKHLDRTILCDATIEDISLDELKAKYFAPKTVLVNCPKCTKGFSSTFGLKKHVDKCTATVEIVSTNNVTDIASTSTSAEETSYTKPLSLDNKDELLTLLRLRLSSEE